MYRFLCGSLFMDVIIQHLVLYVTDLHILDTKSAMLNYFKNRFLRTKSEPRKEWKLFESFCRTEI